ncbi:universal stress protein [Ferrimonas gelatinilytica]|uniref:UspA domain-containing protein n=1 Tax=Ferrimonas gelatinilytica TaxID=1255257 RepID=A0ABP9RTG2_9GAMM
MKPFLVIVPTPELSTEPLVSALALAQSTGRALLVLHHTANEAQTLSLARCHSLAQQCSDESGQVVQFYSQCGSPLYEAIDSVLRLTPCDLIIKSQDGEPMDWQVLKRSPLPVWMLTPKVRVKKGTVVAALDLGHRSPRVERLNVHVLKQAKCLAQAQGAELHVLYVPVLAGFWKDLDLLNARWRERRAMENKTLPLAWLAGEGVTEERIHVKAGNPGLVIRDMSCALGANTLVLGCVPRRGLMAAIKGEGGLPQQLMAHLSCHLLLVPEKSCVDTPAVNA